MTLYRAVFRWPVAAGDFQSDEAKGLRPRQLQLADPRLYTGISMFSDLVQVHARRVQYPAFPPHTVEVMIPDGAPVEILKTLGRAHYTVIGTAEVLMGYVVRLVE